LVLNGQRVEDASIAAKARARGLNGSNPLVFYAALRGRSDNIDVRHF
jgi:hypothetical protein